MANSLSHLDEHGHAHMVDVSGKPDTPRMAIARSEVHLTPDTLNLIVSNSVPKGDVFATARLAGIMAAKKTSELIPLCHPLPLTHVEIQLDPQVEFSRVRCRTTVKTSGQTGVEMEALTATQIALLTIYDMCKAVDRGMVIQGVRLLEKIGGKSGHWQASPDS